MLLFPVAGSLTSLMSPQIWDTKTTRNVPWTQATEMAWRSSGGWFQKETEGGQALGGFQRQHTPLTVPPRAPAGGGQAHHGTSRHQKQGSCTPNSCGALNVFLNNLRPRSVIH